MTPSLLDKLLLVTSLFKQDMARAFAGTPLTESRLTLLWTLALSGPSTQQALSEALSVTPRNVSGLVDALEEHGYLERIPHPSDRRAVLVQLTARGDEVMTRMRQDHAELDDQLRNAVAPEHRVGFDQGLDAVVARLTELVTAAQSTPGGYA